ncbi:uncharacterized protein LOC110765943 [Prunus avium]|uniref:Uncharacterized protein LOC110765943 n=1 Tax=Prunus avium TaxID=42229 RepID=A0A6P5TCQ0_PRUAV|nr:uncharacterized protein LOC110765943 [Prunus avium]
MASDDVSESMQLVLGKDEFEDFEVTEVDGALLWDLLEELENEEEEKKDEKIGDVDDANSMTDGQVSVEQHDEICTPDLKWGDADMAETNPSSYEMEAWFADDMVGMVDFGCGVGDFPQLRNGLHIGASCNEITYNCLWGDS